MNKPVQRQIAKRFVQCLMDHDIKLVCFDFDETITVGPGKAVSNTFRRVVQEMKKKKLRGAIVTFNIGFPIAAWLRIHEIELPIVSRVSPADVSFGKQWHIREAMTTYNTRLSNASDMILGRNVLLIDDLKNNVEWARNMGYVALEVQCKRGLTSNDLVRCMANSSYYFKKGKTFVPSWSCAELFTQSRGNWFLCADSSELVLDPRLHQLVLHEDPYHNLVYFSFRYVPETRTYQPEAMITEISLLDHLEKFPQAGKARQ